MSLMMWAVPAALILLVYAVVLAVSGIQRQNGFRIAAALGILTLLGSGAAVLMEFLTRPF
ncbi:MAG: hypothetical protein HFF83_05360 [Oscillibacter sp.]|jgi:hypothetical protein|nr:hypothetical protein [Oscillibacter sp.]